MEEQLEETEDIGAMLLEQIGLVVDELRLLNTEIKEIKEDLKNDSKK